MRWLEERKQTNLDKIKNINDLRKKQYKPKNQQFVKHLKKKKRYSKRQRRLSNIYIKIKVRKLYTRLKITRKQKKIRTKNNKLEEIKKKLIEYKIKLDTKPTKKYKKSINLKSNKKFINKNEPLVEKPRRKRKLKIKNLLLNGRALVKFKRKRRNKRKKLRVLRNRFGKENAKSKARVRYYPIALYGLVLQNKRMFFLPPSRKGLHLLKILLLLFVLILESPLKNQLYFLTTLRQLLVNLFKLPGFIPKFFLIRQINLLLIKEFTFRHLNVSYFKKLFKSRFMLFQGAFKAITTSIKSFDLTKKISVAFIGMYVRNVTAALVCNYIVHKLGQYFTIQEILKPVLSDLRRSPRLSGFRIVVAGRLTRKERAAFLVRKNGNLTLAKNDANIDYASDFKIMRFGIVGVKVWFQIKHKKPYLYKFVFLFLLIGFYLFREIGINQKNTNGFLVKKKTVNFHVVLKRTFWGRSGMSVMKQRMAIRGSEIGYWQPKSYWGKQTTSPHGIKHRTQIDDSLRTNPKARQSNNALTSKSNAHKIDSTVTETTRLSATKKYDGSPGEQYVSWKDNSAKITPKAVKKHFKKERSATAEEHKKFEESLKGKANSVYKKKQKWDAADRFNDGKTDNHKTTSNKEKNEKNDNNKHEN